MRTHIGLAVLAASILGPVAAVGQPPAAKEPGVAGLAPFLKQRGYADVALLFNKSGLLDVEIQVNGRKALLTVDTGAGHTSLDRASAIRLGLVLRPSNDTTTGLGAAGLRSEMAKVDRLALGAVSVQLDVFVVDFATINAKRRENGDPPCDGVLGGSLLKSCAAVVDYPSGRLYLKSPTAK